MNIEEFKKLKEQLGYTAQISGREEYFRSVVLVLLIPLDGEYHFVFQKRCRNIRQGGELCFPGGRIDETDRTLEQTAIRETVEELGIPREKIEIIGRLDTIVAPMGTIVDAFVGIADIRKEDIVANPLEVESILTIPVSYFMEHAPERYSAEVHVSPTHIEKETGEEIILLPAEELGLPDTYKKPWGGFRYSVLVYKLQNEILWGFTARMVDDFINRIKEKARFGRAGDNTTV